MVDADSNDGAVLVNGNEPEEEWVRIMKELPQPKSINVFICMCLCNKFICILAFVFFILYTIEH